MSTINVDITALAEIWGRDYFRRKATSRKERKLVEQDRLEIEVDWKRVNFVHDAPKYDPEPPTPGTGKPLNNCLYHTTFANKTNHNQTYNFSAQRSTKASCTLEIEQTYSQGMECGITLKTPGEILEANLGFQKELEISNTSEETIEEELTWGVNSDIVVDAKHRAIAKMIITEEEYSGKFTLKTTIKGIIRIKFRNLKDNNSFVRACEIPAYDLVQWGKDNRYPGLDTAQLEKSTGSVVFTTKGSCKFKYGLRQDVEVDQEQIEDE